MGYKFSLVLSREISDEESVALKEAGCSAAVFGTDCLPTNTEVTVTKMDFDDTTSRTLADAIESALEAVKSVPDLTVPGLTVPAQPAGPIDEEPKVVSGEVVEETPSEATPSEETPAKETHAEPIKATEEKPAAKKASPRKPSTRKPSTRKTTATQKVDVPAES